ncbi:MAG: hypothetical protein IJU44_03500 [Kiritimatiellae bacterium]|nr:hypothetical protein [Kiritimatiellia bacterium]
MHKQVNGLYLKTIALYTIVTFIPVIPEAQGAGILDDAKASGKGAVVLAYGSDWSEAGRAVCRTCKSEAFRKAVESRYIVGTIDLREKPTDESKKSCKYAEAADLDSFKTPALYLVGPNGRGFLVLENIPAGIAAGDLAAKVAAAELVRDKAEALIAEAGNMEGAAAAEKIGEALSMLEPQLGTVKRLLDKKCYGAVFERIKTLDPNDDTSWQRRFTMGNGVGIITEVNAAREKNNFEKGEQIIAREKAKSARHLTLNQRQALELLPFALYRTDETRKAENITLLDSIAAQDSTTLWGMAAVGFLNRYGATEAGKYIKPKPRQNVLRPRGMSQNIEGFDPKAVITADMHTLENIGTESLASLPPECRTALVRSYILVSAGDNAVTHILSREGGEKFLNAFFADREWMEAFAGSGPWHYGADSALELLDIMAWNEPGIYTNSFQRTAATAFAMNFSVTNSVTTSGSQILTNAAPLIDEKLVRTLQIFTELSSAGRLHDSIYSFDTYEWRYVMYPWDENDPEELLAMNAFCNTTMAKTFKLGWKIPYRLRNCFGESVHKPEYFQPWIHAQSRYATSPEIGGVCGMISSFASKLGHSHGMMAVIAGQPWHCAFEVRPERGGPRQWEVRYYIQPYTKGKWGVFKWGGYQNILAAEALYTATGLPAREYPRWLATVRRAKSADTAFSPEIAALYRTAMENAPCNWPAGHDWQKYLLACNAPEQAWDDYADTVLKTVSNGLPILCELMKPYLDTLTAPEKAAELDSAFKRIVSAIRLPESKFSEYPNFSQILNLALDRVGKISAKRLFNIYSTALESQASCGEFFSQTLAWGAKRYIGRPDFEEAYTKLVYSVLEKNKPAAAGPERSGAKFVLRKMMVEAESAALRDRRDRIIALMDKLYPRTPAKSNGKAYPLNDFGGELISSNAYVQISRLSYLAKPELHGELCDASPTRSLRDGTPVLAIGTQGGTWIRLQLEDGCEATGILIVNTLSKKRRAAQLPMRVEVSVDGKEWRQIAMLDQPADFWRIPLDGSQGSVRFVRVWTEGVFQTSTIRLSKFLVYGRKQDERPDEAVQPAEDNPAKE